MKLITCLFTPAPPSFLFNTLMLDTLTPSGTPWTPCLFFSQQNQALSNLSLCVDTYSADKPELHIPLDTRVLRIGN